MDHQTGYSRTQDPSSVPQLTSSGYAAFQRGDFRESARFFYNAISNTPKPTSQQWLTLATSLVRGGMYKEASHALVRCVAAGTDDATITQCLKIDCELMLQKRRQGENLIVLELSVCEAAIHRDPSDKNMMSVLGQVLHEAGLFKEAEAYFHNAYFKDPSDREMFYALCLSYLRAGECDEAIPCTKDLLDVYIDHHKTLDLRGITLNTCGIKNKEATDSIIRANELLAEESTNPTLGCPKGFKLEMIMPKDATEVRVVDAGGVEYGVDPKAVALPPESVSRVNWTAPNERYIDKRTAIIRMDDVYIEGEPGFMMKGGPACKVYYNDQMFQNRMMLQFKAGNNGRDVVEIEEPVAMAVQQIPGNYYHSTLETFGRMSVLKKFLLDDHPEMPLVISNQRFIQDGARFLHLSPEYGRKVINWTGDEVFHFKTVYLVDWRHEGRDPHSIVDSWSLIYPPRFAVRLSRELIAPKLTVDTAQVVADRGTWKIVYLSRRDTPVRRVERIEPQFLADVEKMVGKDHLVVFEGSTRTLREQIDILADAVLLLGPHGAGFTNQEWMPEGAVVMRFPMIPDSDQCMSHLSAALGHRYREIPSINAMYYGAYNPTACSLVDMIRAVHFALAEFGIKTELPDYAKNPCVPPEEAPESSENATKVHVIGLTEEYEQKAEEETYMHVHSQRSAEKEMIKRLQEAVRAGGQMPVPSDDEFSEN